MNKLNFLRPRALKHRGGKAHFTRKGLRVNTDGTTIADRKPRLQLCHNHRHTEQRGSKCRSWMSKAAGTAYVDLKGWYTR